MSALAEPDHGRAKHRPQRVRARRARRIFLRSLSRSRACSIPASPRSSRTPISFGIKRPGAPPLTGIHVALEIEEASLIAVPDAMQRGWQPLERASRRHRRRIPRRVPHPSWWHFLECDPPESPPSGRTTNRVAAISCNAICVFFTPPELSVEGPDAAGPVYPGVERAPDAALQFILEEATEPDFSNAVELWRGGGTSHTILSRAPGHLLLPRSCRSRRRVEQLVE